MKTNMLEMRTVFGLERRLLVPLFQRPYVWKREKQWEPLWDDLRKIAERIAAGQEVRPHFLGAIVLEQVQNAMGSLETRYVIDGQQRLTTIQILLEALADLCAAKGMERHHRLLRKLTRNDDPLSTDPDVAFKVWPTNVDREDFRRVMNSGSPMEVKQAYGIDAKRGEVGRPIGDAYLYYYEAFEAWLDSGATRFETRLDSRIGALRERLRVVVIDLEDEDDAQLIFETLNARGTPLLPADLVKNYLFHRAQASDKKLQSLYEAYWEPFDSDRYWREELGVGHNVRARIDVFLQNYLSLHTADEVPVGHLYNAFCEQAENQPGGDVIAQLKSLRAYADVFRGFEVAKGGTRKNLFFTRLEAMDITSAHPFLLELFKDHAHAPQEIEEILVCIESFLVRRMVCQLNTRGYNRLFLDLLKQFRAKNGSPSARVRAFLASQEADSNRWPRDRDFKAAWRDAPVYRRLVKRRIRMLLEALELRLHSDHTERLRFEEKLTIEHLLPRKWVKHWPLPGNGNAEEEHEVRDRVLHTIGNLTLLTKKLNPKISNGPWSRKRELILEHSALSLNRNLQKQWDEGLIEERSDELFKTARKIWPEP